MQRTALIALALAQLGVPDGAPTPVAQAPPPLTFAVLGDSNSLPDPYFDAWWEYLAFNVPQWQVEFVGWTAAQAVVDGLAQAEAALAHDPDVVLCMLGTNDVPFYATDEILAAYEAIELYCAPTPVVFVGPLEVEPWGLVDPTTFNAAIAKLQVDVDLVDDFGPDAYRLPVDGIHLDGEGQRQLGYLVQAVLLERYGS